MSSLLLFAFAFSLVKDVPYDASVDAAKGDLYLPDRKASETPVVLLIHGGGWSSGSRNDTVGMAEFFARELGFAVYNIEYRLAKDDVLWPTCGNDCVAAANFLLSSGFKAAYGLDSDKVWICGGSAGGHLALWTLVNLPTDKVAGAIAVSPIGDPVPDQKANPSRYATLFGGTPNLPAMDPCTRITSGMAPLLVTHATDDTVVPIKSSKNFAAAYEAVGNTVEYFEYANDLEPNIGGHCIWRSDETPHRLLDSLERKIGAFVRAQALFDPTVPTGEIAARAIHVDAVDYSSAGTITNVSLSFGPGNGFANLLSIAYGRTAGGGRSNTWEHVEFVRTVDDSVKACRVQVPVSARRIKFFLDVPLPDGGVGEPVKWITADGTQYVDTGIKLQSGDAVNVRFQPSAKASMALLGYRKSKSDAKDVNVNVVLNKSNQAVAFYSASAAVSDCQLVATYAAATWYDIVLSPSRRAVINVATGACEENTVLNTDSFVCTEPCYLFSASGNPSVTDKAKGSVSAFRIDRGVSAVASYLPYKIDGTYGFYDRVSGTFKTSAVAGAAFSGADDSELSTPLSSVTETLAARLPTEEVSARQIVSCRTMSVDGSDCVEATFGPDNGLENRLFFVSGTKDCGDDWRQWDNVTDLGVLSPTETVRRVCVPQDVKRCRFVVSLAAGESELPIPLRYVSGDGTSSLDLGLSPASGDEVVLKVRPATIARSMQIFGSRPTKNLADGALTIVLASKLFMIDYTKSGTDCRCTATENARVDAWYEIKAGPNERSVTELSTPVRCIGVNQVPCADEFSLPGSALLYDLSGYTVCNYRFQGDVASLSVRRNGSYLRSLCPCLSGADVGFYDRGTMTFMALEGEGFAAGEFDAGSPLVCIGEVQKVNRAGQVIVIR